MHVSIGIKKYAKIQFDYEGYIVYNISQAYIPWNVLEFQANKKPPGYPYIRDWA